MHTIRHAAARALLLLVAPVLGATTATAQEGFEEAISLVEKLGCPDVAESLFVQVATGRSVQYGEEPPVNTFLHGFLLKDEGPSFEVLTDDLRRETFARTPAGTPDHQRVSYEAVELADFAQKVIEGFPADGEHVFWSRGMHHPMAYHTTCTALFFYAWGCHAQGEEELARALAERSLEAFHRDARGRSRGPAGDLGACLASDLGHAAMWRLIVDFGNREVSPRELHERAAAFGRTFPDHEHAPRAAETATILARMLAEEAARPKATVPLEQLPIAERAAELVFRLRDQNGHQWSQPGSCDVFADPRGDESPAARLCALGLAALPALIEAIDDDSFTRSVGYHRNFYFSHHVLRVSDCAQLVLGRITGTGFANAAAARAWLEDLETRGEKAVWTDGARAGNITHAAWLAARHPEAAFDPIREAFENSGNDYGRQQLIALVGTLDSDDARSFLREQMHRGPTPRCRLAAAAALIDTDREAALDGALGIWREPTTDQGEELEHVALFLAVTGETRAIEALAEHPDRLDDDVYAALRDEEAWLIPVSSPDGEGGWRAVRSFHDGPWSEATLAAVERLCLSQLENDRVFHGSYGSVQEPRVCDFAARTLNARWPERYPFDFEAPRRERDRRLLALESAERAKRGEPSRTDPAAVVIPPVPAEVVEPLLARYRRVDLDADRERIAAEVEAVGLGALPHVARALESATRDHRPALDALAQRLASHVAAARLDPRSTPADDDVARTLEAMVARPLDPDTVTALAARLVRDPPAGVGGYVLDVERDAGGTGILVTLRLRRDPEPKRPPWQSASSWIHAQVGRRGLCNSFGTGTIDSYAKPERFDDFANALREAVRSSWRESIEARIEIRLAR